MNPWENDPIATADAPWESDPVADAPAPWENDPPEDADLRARFHMARGLDDTGRIGIQDVRALQPGLQLAREPLPQLDAPDFQPPIADLSAATAAQEVQRLYALLPDAEAEANQPYAPNTARQRADAARMELINRGMAPEDVDARLEDARKLDFGPSTSGMPRGRRLSDGTIVVDPSLAFQPEQWNAAAAAVAASPVELENAQAARLALREDLAPEVENLAARSGAYMDWLAAKAQERGLGGDIGRLYDTATSGDLLEQFYKETGTGFGNLGSLTAASMKGAVASTGQGIYGALDMVTPDFITGSGPAELAQVARSQANEYSAIADAISGGWWAKRAANVAGGLVSSLPAIAASPLGFGAMLTAGGALQAGQTQSDALAAGFSPMQANAMGLGSGAMEAGITAMFGKTGVEAMTKPGAGGLLKRTLKGGVEELPEELLQQAAQVPVQQAITPGYRPTVAEFGDVALTAFVAGGGVNALNGPPKTQTAAQPGAKAPIEPPEVQPDDLNIVLGDLQSELDEIADNKAPSAPAPSQPAGRKAEADPIAETGFDMDLAPFLSSEETGVLMGTPAELLPDVIDKLSAAARSRKAMSERATMQATTPTVEAPPAAVAPNEDFARRYSFPRGLLPFVTPEEAGVVAAAKEGQIQLTAVQSLMRKAQDRMAQANASATATAPQPATPDGPAQPAPAQQTQGTAPAATIGEDQGTSGMEAGSASPGTLSEEDTVRKQWREQQEHLRDVELRDRLNSKSKDTRHNAEVQLMARAGLPWTNKPEQAALTKREREKVEARIAAREAQWNAELEAQGVTISAEPETQDENIPFSQEKVTQRHDAVTSAVSQALAELGVGADVVQPVIIRTVDEIADPTLRAAATASVAAGNRVNAFYTPGTNGAPAKATFISGSVKPEKARELVMHEVAGHHGLRVLFNKRAKDWAQIVERLWERLSKVKQFPADLVKRTGYNSLAELSEIYHRPDEGQNYDPVTFEGRSNLIEEHLAHLAQHATKPSWWAAVVSQIRELVRKISGGRAFKTFSDADVQVLLSKARKASRKPGSQQTGARFIPQEGAMSQERESAALDSEYMSAVNRGDMEAAQRMVDEAAKNNGFRVKASHGTDANHFTVFDTEKNYNSGKTRDPNSFVGSHFAADKSVSVRFADGLYGATGGRVMDVYLAIKNPLQIGNGEPSSRILSALEADYQAASKAYDEHAARRAAKGLPDNALEILESGDAGRISALFEDVAGDALHKKMNDALGKIRDAKDKNRPVTEAELLEIAGFNWGEVANRLAASRGESGRRYAKQVGAAVRSALLSKGYDGVFYWNAMEDERGIGGDGKSYIALHPSQIKSADPITYDDAGNVIPLSQRFNEASPDIRFSQEKAERDARADVQALLAKARKASRKPGSQQTGARFIPQEGAMSQERDAAALDSEYMAAVNRGDMETAQRMVDDAAYEAGFRMLFQSEAIDNRDRDAVAVTLFKGEKIIGAVTLTKTGGRNLTVNDAGIKPEFQRNGLYDMALREVERNGYSVSPDSQQSAAALAFWVKRREGKAAISYDASGNVIPLSQRFNEASPDIRFSQEKAERDARAVERALLAKPEDLEQYQTQRKLKESPTEPDAVKQAMNGVYAVYTDRQAQEDARRWIESAGADEVERIIIGNTALDKRDIAAAVHIRERLNAMGLHERSAVVTMKVLEKVNTQAQAIQAMHMLLDRTTQDGAEAWARKRIERAGTGPDGKQDPEIARLQALLDELQKKLQQFRYDMATGLLVKAERTFRDAASLTPARQVELSDKLRKALVTDDGTDATKLRVKGLLVAAGGEEKAATKHAGQLVDRFRQKVKTARAAVIRKILKVPDVAKRVPKGQFSKWEKLNDEGVLTDSRMFGDIAARFKFPVFTQADSDAIRGFLDEYNKATDPTMKFIAGVKMLEYVQGRTDPATLADKADTLYKLTKLLSFKTVERNVIGNTVAALWTSIGVDVPLWMWRKGASLVTGRKVAPLQTSIGNMVRGQREVNRIYKLGRDTAIAGGATKWEGVKAGNDAVMTAARYHLEGYRDAQTVRRAYRSVFTSKAGQMFEKVMSAALTLPDLGRFYGEIQASLAKQLAETPGAVLPTAEMYEAAYQDGLEAIYQKENFLSKSLNKIRDALNFGYRFGIGSIVLPFITVPAGLFLMAVNWGPLGFVRAMYRGARAIRGQETGENFAKAFISAATGTAALPQLGYWLAGLGIIATAHDEDKDIEDLQKASGWQSYAINTSMLKRRMVSGDWFSKQEAQDGDAMLSISWAQPIAFSLVAGAERHRRDTLTADQPQTWWERHFTNPVGAAMQQFLEMPMMTGLQQLSRDYATSQRTGNFEPLLRLPIRALDFVPAIVRDVRYIGNNAQPETRSSNVIEAEVLRILGGVPGVDLPQRYNVLGKAEERYQAGTNSILNVLFNPATMTFIRKNPVADEALRLYRATGDKSVTPRTVDRSITINTSGIAGKSQKLELSAEEISKLSKLQGQLGEGLMRVIIAQPGWAQTNDAGRAKMMSMIFSASQNAAKAVTFGHKLVTIGEGGVNADKEAMAAIALGKAQGLIP